MGYKIKEVSDISGISIRMLRHYDKNGLLWPDVILPNGYRNYSQSNIDRLQKIMYLKELDFSVSDMKKILDGSAEDMIIALQGQKALLLEKKERLDGIIQLIEKSINGEEFKNNMDKFKAFDMKEIEVHKKKYAKETEKRFGKSKEYAQSQKKTSGYTKEDWKRITEEAEAIYLELAGLTDGSPDAEKAISAAVKWRNHINEYYYVCSDEVFAGLADMYVLDPRFTKNIDKHGVGLAKFMSDAMKASLKS